MRLPDANPTLSRESVSTLELFFDLVFVFTISQVTALITPGEGWAAYGRAGLVLSLIWWMYDGYAWLSNNVRPVSTATRLPMLLAMAAFLAMGSTVPVVFGSGAWVFATAYLAVVTIHGLQFLRSAPVESARAIRSVLPVNYAVALLLVAAAAIGPTWGWTGWTAALVLVVVSVSTRDQRGFALQIEHFAERHGLVIIIALGETVIAVGRAMGGRWLQASLLPAAMGAFVLVSGLWWCYFASGDDARVAATIRSSPLHHRGRLALKAYSLSHLLHVAGLVLLAAGLEQAIAESGEPAQTTTAFTLATGTAAYLVAQTTFRSILRLTRSAGYVTGTVLSFATVPPGRIWSAGAQVVLLAVIVAAIAVNQRTVSRPG